MTRASLERVLLYCRWPLAAFGLAISSLLARGDDPPDLASFGARGDLILHGHLSPVYASSWNQAGPLQLVVARLLMLGSSTDRPLYGIELVVDVALLVLLRAAARRCGVSLPGQLALGGAALVWLGPNGLWSGHPVEVAVVPLWLLAARYAARNAARDPARCGLLLGLSALVAPWAVLAFALAFVGPSRVRSVRSIVVAAAVTVIGYLPFVVSGHFALFDYEWLINRHTLLHLLAPGLVHFPWGLRVIQGLGALGGSLLVIRHVRPGRDTLWIAPLVAVLVRILLDPVLLGYYWLPAGVLVIAAGAMGWATSRSKVITLALLAYLTYFGAVGLAPAVFCVLALAVLAFLGRAEPRSDAKPAFLDRAEPRSDAKRARSAAKLLVGPEGFEPSLERT